MHMHMHVQIVEGADQGVLSITLTKGLLETYAPARSSPSPSPSPSTVFQALDVAGTSIAAAAAAPHE